MTIFRSFYDKKFCVFDEISIPACDLPEADPDLKRILSYHPIRNSETLIEKNIPFETDYLYDPNRDIVETDRTGFRYYDRIYTHYISKFKEKNINLLEIGIEYGYGLLAWSRYFKNSNVYGIELNYDYFYEYYEKIKRRFPEESKRIFFSSGDSRVGDHWKENYNVLEFDVIIDDGGHKYITQFTTAKNGMKHLKQKNCYYFIEDFKLEYKNDKECNEIYNGLLELKKYFIFKDVTVYRHINPGRFYLVNLLKEERFKETYNLHMKRTGNHNKSLEITTNDLKIDTNNYYNYMIVFSK